MLLIFGKYQTHKFIYSSFSRLKRKLHITLKPYLNSKIINLSIFLIYFIAIAVDSVNDYQCLLYLPIFTIFKNLDASFYVTSNI